jgi:hypothetical protein
MVHTNPAKVTRKLTSAKCTLLKKVEKMGAKEKPNMNPAKNKPNPGARNRWGKTSFSEDKATATQLTKPVVM